MILDSNACTGQEGVPSVLGSAHEVGLEDQSIASDVRLRSELEVVPWRELALVDAADPFSEFLHRVDYYSI